MSEVQQNDGGGKKKGGKPKGKKASTHIDMTPMVDLAFLLLTFFMLTTSFSKPKVMPIVLPEKQDKDTKDLKINEKNVMNLLLQKDGKISYFLGVLGQPDVEIHTTNYSPKGLREVVRTEMEKNIQMNGGKNKLFILIKPAKGSTYGNVVDVFDEMNILNAQLYALVDITPNEQKYLDEGH